MQSSTWPRRLHGIKSLRLPMIQGLFFMNLWPDRFGIKGRMRPNCARSHFPHNFQAQIEMTCIIRQLKYSKLQLK